jgi:hypothetical protein
MLNSGLSNTPEDYRSFFFSIIIKRSLLPSEYIDLQVNKFVFNYNIIDPAAEDFILDHNRSF